MGKHRRDRHKKNRNTTTSNREASPSKEGANMLPSIPDTNKIVEPDIYSEDCKRVEDYGEFVKIIGNMPEYVLESVLYTKPKDGCICYVPSIPFLGKYKNLYYKLDEVTEQLLPCFVDW
jgi:hypothetical protein